MLGFRRTRVSSFLPEGMVTTRGRQSLAARFNQFSNNRSPA
jgi:hypothetical protein